MRKIMLIRCRSQCASQMAHTADGCELNLTLSYSEKSHVNRELARAIIMTCTRLEWGITLQVRFYINHQPVATQRVVNMPRSIGGVRLKTSHTDCEYDHGSIQTAHADSGYDHGSIQTYFRWEQCLIVQLVLHPGHEKVYIFWC